MPEPRAAPGDILEPISRVLDEALQSIDGLRQAR